ncbi:hypothetical protein MNV49_006463 [Pseudohyphozyma bogoriensis]|nr:hypothetical protein MNV49_006463 [Pseudohyphozyma bogoriensis]
MGVDLTGALAELEATLATLPASDNPYLAVDAFLHKAITTLSYPAYYRQQLLVLVSVFGLIVVLLVAGLVIRCVRDRKAFWFFRILEAHEHRYIAPHAVVAWSTAFVVECALAIAMIRLDLEFYASGTGSSVFLWPSITCIIVSHLVQRQLEAQPPSLFASPILINTLAPLSLVAFLATVVPLTIRPYLSAVKGFAAFDDASAMLKVMGSTWKEGDAFSIMDLASVYPSLSQASGEIQEAINRFVHLLYAYDAWTLAIIGVLDIIGFIRLRVIHVHMKKMTALSMSSLLGVTVLLSGSAFTFVAISLYGGISGEPQKIGEQCALVVLYTMAGLGLPTSVILIQLALQVKNTGGPTTVTTSGGSTKKTTPKSFGFKRGSVARHGIHVLTEATRTVEIGLSRSGSEKSYQSYPLEEVRMKATDEKVGSGYV